MRLARPVALRRRSSGPPTSCSAISASSELIAETPPARDTPAAPEAAADTMGWNPPAAAGDEAGLAPPTALGPDGPPTFICPSTFVPTRRQPSHCRAACLGHG